ncbi:MAG: flagellar basal-body MS-ring/collar protein FliF [Candidatus Hydrogenedentota bacterium]
MDFLRQFLGGIAGTWQSLSLSARINLVLWGLAVVVVIALVIFVGSRPQYVTLSDQVTAKNVVAIRDLIEEQNIPYRLADNNTTLKVPMEHLSDAQLILAQNNIPVGRRMAPGFDLFDQQDLMTNRYLQDVQFMRALQGELEQILNDFEFIEHSRVIIREARDELFRRDEKPAEALVTLQSTRSLTDDEVKGIVSLVAQGGGPNLNREQVTVMATDGQVLASPPDSEFASMANSKREYIVQLEKEREQRVIASLRDMGVRATVRVSAQVDFDEEEVTQELAEEGPEISTYTTSAEVSSTENLPEGAPGTMANIAEAEAEGGVTHSEETTESIANMEPSYTRTTTRSGPGDVIKYMVALVVEGEYEEETNAEGEVLGRNYLGLTDDRRETYTDLARMAVGAGEVETEVVLHDHPFEVGDQAVTAAAISEAQAERAYEVWGQRAWLAGQVVLILLGFGLLRLFLRRAVEAPEEEGEESPEAPEESAVSAAETRRQQINEEVSRLSQEQPELVTTLLRSWLAEDEE